MEIRDKITEQITNNDVVLYMKGTPQFPQCGFSSLAVEILKRCGVAGGDLITINVLEDPDIRQGIKDYSNWPTVPQLYFKGEFIGGADIMREMFEKGEIQTLLGDAGGVGDNKGESE